MVPEAEFEQTDDGLVPVSAGSFAYTVVRPDESAVIGCVYFYPSEHDDYVDVRMWVTRQAWEVGLDAELEGAVRDWVTRDWPFERPFWHDR
jgi:hypothetical protein